MQPRAGLLRDDDARSGKAVCTRTKATNASETFRIVRTVAWQAAIDTCTCLVASDIVRDGGRKIRDGRECTVGDVFEQRGSPGAQTHDKLPWPLACARERQRKCIGKQQLIRAHVNTAKVCPATDRVCLPVRLAISASRVPSLFYSLWRC